ncbi:MAG: oligosaccharide flippase family protein [Desulfoarculaceae bacterium]|nr:oligosaccharide flippase family protein [Desulfoarculaceae bacterium]
MGAGCAFLTQVLLARELGPAAFGAFAAALAMVVLVAPLAGFGVAGFWLKAFGQEGWQAVRWLRASLKYTLLNTLLVLVG